MQNKDMIHNSYKEARRQRRQQLITDVILFPPVLGFLLFLVWFLFCLIYAL